MLRGNVRFRRRPRLGYVIPVPGKVEISNWIIRGVPRTTQIRSLKKALTGLMRDMEPKQIADPEDMRQSG